MIPKVSIIIPAYNAERFVKRCLDSVLAQQYESFEVIAVDDGSTDQTGTLLDEYAIMDSRIKVVHKHNGGVSSARNEGLNLAIGEWVAFVDIDDMVSSDFLSKRDFDINTSLIVKSWRYTDGTKENENIVAGIIAENRMNSFLSQALHFNVFRTPWAKLFRRDFIEQIGLRFDTNYRLGEDNLFVLTYLKSVKSIQVSDVGFYQYEKAINGKYSLNFRDAYNYICDFANLYFQLGISCPLLVKNKLIWYSSFISNFSKRNKILWYTDRKISRMYMVSINLFPLVTKFKIVFYSIVSVIRFK